MSKKEKYGDQCGPRGADQAFEAFVDGRATEAQLKELTETLRGDRTRLRDYVEFVGIHSALQWIIAPHNTVDASELNTAQAIDPGSSEDSAVAQLAREWLSPTSSTTTQGGGLQARSESALSPSASASPDVRAMRFPSPHSFIASLTWKTATSIFAVTASLVLMVNYFGWQRSEQLQNVQCAEVTRCSSTAQWSVLHPKFAPTMKSELLSGETIHLTSGEMLLSFDNGAKVNLSAPAVFQVVDADSAIAVRGKLTAYVDEEAVGFSIDTPRARVIDLGTRFGVDVGNEGQTDVVVFEGEVDLLFGPVETYAADRKRRVMKMGEAVRVDGHGDANRIVSITSDRFSSGPDAPAVAASQLIIDVRDNIRGEDSWNYYEVVHGGMREDALAFVDRVEHEWNGLDKHGMPHYLIGGDYIRGFNSDKWAESYHLDITIAKPAKLYILFDDRVPPPDWLTEGFKDTGDNVGLDRGMYYTKHGYLYDQYSAGIGPGVSIEDTMSVWVQTVDEPCVVRLGDPQSPNDHFNMYGIVATPLR